MKKIILSLSIAAILLSSFTIAQAAGKDPNTIVKQAFNKEFIQVKDVEWTTVNESGVYQAKFIFNNEPLQAFFAEDGQFLGTTRQLSKSQLPIIVVTALEKQYPDMHVATIFEFSKKEGTDYYITVTGTKSAMMLKASGSGELSIYKKNVQ
ncbi:MAG: hypothetical protein ABI813_10025 [Bacteroidota bacterium]